MVITTISLFFKTYFGIYKAKSHHLHLSFANALNTKIRWAYYAVSQLSFSRLVVRQPNLSHVFVA